MQSSRPLLVIVSGAPASGKTTLARRLAADLGLRLLSKDAIKEGICDAVGAPEDVAASQRLGVAAYVALHALAGELIGAGLGAVVESNFWRDRPNPDLAMLAGRGEARVVHCSAAPSVVMRRYHDRHRDGERHAAHRDHERLADLEASLGSGRYGPPALGVPCLDVRTDDGYLPGYEEILRFARGART